MTEVCSLSSGLYEIAKMSGTTKDDSGAHSTPYLEASQENFDSNFCGKTLLFQQWYDV
jgi:hypothetical protein